jgi:hypothetical protein
VILVGVLHDALEHEHVARPLVVLELDVDAQPNELPALVGEPP